MARTTLTPIAATSQYPTAPQLVTFTAGDIANGLQFTMSGKDLILIFNNDAGAQTVTINSVADPFSRTGDITAFSMAIGGYYIVGPLPKLGWQQAGGFCFLTSSTITVKFAIIQIP